MLQIQDWGLIDYNEALEKQLALINHVHAENSEGILVFCTHPAVVTLGRATQPGDVFAWSGPVKEISRGGRATYHGPSQLVIYPIINLEHQRPARDIAAYLRNLEYAIVKTLGEYGIQSQGRSLQQKMGMETPTEETGVWVGSQKIASLGIGVRKWITYHGAAINLDEDPQAFVGMKPCGFSGDVMVSLQRLLNSRVDRQGFQSKLLTHLQKSLQT